MEQIRLAASALVRSPCCAPPELCTLPLRTAAVLVREGVALLHAVAVTCSAHTGLCECEEMCTWLQVHL